MAQPAGSPFVTSRAVGAATVTIISDGSGRSTVIKQLEVPPEQWRAETDVDANDEVVIGYNLAHLRVGDASILIDLGFDDPSPASTWRAPRHQRSPGLEAGLATIGVTPDEITHVLITHAHGDHIAGGSVARGGRRVPRFPTAPHWLGRGDWEGAAGREQPDSPLATHLGPVAEAGLLRLVDIATDIVPGVLMIPSPGESPGHCIIRLDSGGEQFFFVGDLFHHPCEVAHLDWVLRGRDAPAMMTSRQWLVTAALETDALLATSHMPFPGLGRLRREGDGVRWVAEA
jgi:glyoxylase-like metal-dependent hydrolase (beta-lactamase superfamily II)